MVNDKGAAARGGVIELPLIYVDLIKSPPISRRRRQQPWRWVAKNGRNNRKLARSTERYTNRDDCLLAIEQLFGTQSTVFLREAEHGNVPLRRAA